MSLSMHAQKSPEQLGGVYYAYPSTSENMAGRIADSSLRPVYLSHYGRHGSRWLPNDERYEWVNKQFADPTNLTPLGKKVRKRLQKVWKNARGNGGRLTSLGARQHAGIALRMMQRHPQLFNTRTQIWARSSTVDRCRQSMLAFMRQLNNKMKGLKTDVATDSADMAWLVNNTHEIKELERRNMTTPDVSADRLLESLFVDPSRLFADEKQASNRHPVPIEKMRERLSRKLLSELFTIATDMQDVELNVNLFDLFTREEMEAIYRANNRRMSLVNGRMPQTEGIPARAAVSLWQNFEQRTDEALRQQHPAVDLRFGHDTNLYRLLSLLQVSSLNATAYDCMDEILPMAANLQMVFYRDQSHDEEVMLELLHNERPVSLPEADIRPVRHMPDGRMLYRWTDMKAYMAERIHRLGHLEQLYSLNTMVGTAQANTRSAGLFGKGSEEHGQTLPAVLAPNGQNFWTPQTQDTEVKCIAPYYYKDALWQGFRNSHWIVGGCTQDYGSFTVAALGGNLRTTPQQRATPFSHSDEQSHPHYYSVLLQEERLRAELTATSHAAIMRVTPLEDGPVHIVVNPNSDEGQAYIEVDTLRRLIYGFNPVHRIYQGWGEQAGFSGHFVLKYTDETVDFGCYEGEAPQSQQCSVNQQPSPSDLTATHHPQLATPVGCYLTLKGRRGQPIELRMASSFTSREGAMRNLEAESNGVTFEEMQASLAQRWIDRFHAIDVEDADTARVRQFYGAFYRASFLPREMSDADGAYPRFASSGSTTTVIHPSEPGRRFFTDFSMWDTYRAVHPLYNIIAPSLSAEMMQSLVTMYEQGTWMPIFPCWNSYTAAMIGDHCAVALADAYVKGIGRRDVHPDMAAEPQQPWVDYEKAYEGMRKNAFETPADAADYRNGMGRRALTSYLKYGYIPLEDGVGDAFHTNEQTSRTLEYAFDDFAVAQLARGLGRQDDYTRLMQRSGNWRNVINPLTGWTDGRHADGRWENNLDVTHRKSYITEGATCHYTWYVPHDVQGLMSLVNKAVKHGENSSSMPFVQRLDSMFSQGYYWHGNEPCHQMAYLFNAAGRPDLTQRWVRHILDTEYNDSPGGLSGNDDAGQMSTWYMFSAIGFYPLCPATTRYEMSAPTFQRVTFNLENKKTFTISTVNASGKDVLVDHATLNHQPFAGTSLTHEQLLQGGELQVVMK